VTGREVFFLETPRGFTASFDAHTIRVLVDLGLIEHDRDEDICDQPHHFYRKAS
jgi:hypothetical protein